MPRDYQIFGECLVKVLGGAHSNVTTATGTKINTLAELGLASEGIIISPVFNHRDQTVDDFGPNTPVDIQHQLATVNIQMSLIHYDQGVLHTCVREAMGGGPAVGSLAPNGKFLGNYKPLRSSGNHFISLNLVPGSLVASGAGNVGNVSGSIEELPWRFPAAYLAENPTRIPVGTKKSIVVLNWRAIPYPTTYVSIDPDNPEIFATAVAELISSGVVLWDHTLESG